MREYAFLQMKRALRLLPLAAMSCALLFLGLAAAFVGVTQLESQSESAQKFRVGLTGDVDSRYLSMGIAAVQSLDSSRFTFELQTYSDPADAAEALKNREISAYLDFPVGFTEAALDGDFQTIRLVVRSNAGGLTLMLKQELSKVITDLLVASQKGVYGVESALEDQGYADIAVEYLNRMNYDYLAFIFDRSTLYETQLWGIADNLSLAEYFFCGFTVFLLLLIGLPYGVVFIRKDWSLSRLLASKGLTAFRQVLCEYAVCCACLLLLAGTLLGLLGAPVRMLLHTLPVIAMAAAFTLLVFELSGNLIHGLLLHFFASLCLCYIAGCFYPIYAFPLGVQAVAPLLPTGAARTCLAAGITGGAGGIWGCLAYGAGFVALTVAARRRKIAGRAG